MTFKLTLVIGVNKLEKNLLTRLTLKNKNNKTNKRLIYLK